MNAHFRFLTALSISCLLLTSKTALAQTCVSGTTATNPTTAYAIAAGIVTDSRAGLAWDQCAWGLSGTACATGTASSLTWQGALAIVATANVATYKGHADWRLPNLKELRSLVEGCRGNPSINEIVFPGTPSTFFWSSSPYANPTNLSWGVVFSDGYGYYDSRTVAYQVRLVRSAP